MPAKKIGSGGSYGWKVTRRPPGTKERNAARQARAEKQRSTAGQPRTKVSELKVRPGRGPARSMVSTPIVHRPIGKGQRGGPMYGYAYDMTIHTQGKRPTVRKYR